MNEKTYYTHSTYPNTIHFPSGKIQGNEIGKGIERLGFVPRKTGCCSEVSCPVLHPWSDYPPDCAVDWPCSHSRNIKPLKHIHHLLPKWLLPKCLNATTDFFFILVWVILVFKEERKQFSKMSFHKKEHYTSLSCVQKKVEHVLRLNIGPHPDSWHQMVILWKRAYSFVFFQR